MILTLYDKLQNKRLEIAPDESSSQSKAIQSDNILSLSFVSYECVAFEVNDYIDFCGERFWVTERYVAKQTSSVEWEYSVKLYGIESLIKKFLVLKLVNGADEAEFSYTATAHDHVTLIVDCINNGMGTTDWAVGDVVDSEYLVVEYTGTYCDEGLKTIAERCSVEYWINGTTVNVCRCEHGENITLGYDNGLTNVYPDKALNAKFFTRLYPIGSSRNIAYEDYGSSRLQLPNSVKYIDKDVDKFGVTHHYERDAFSHIYPRRVGSISSVRTAEATGEDGNTYTKYYFKDSSLDFNPNDYEIAGLVKNISMQSGDLMGRDFEVYYDATTQEFEVVTVWPYDDDTQLPNAQLALETGNQYILWNITMPTEYYPLAEQEFKEAVDEFMAESRLDVSIYKAHTDYIDIAERELNLTIGQRVRLEQDEYFEEGYRNSRITKIARKVVRPTDMDIEISDVLSTGALEKVYNDIITVKNYTKETVSNLPNVIKSWESTSATDYNLYSARKSVMEFLSKKNPDIVQGLITFLAGIEIGETIDSMLAGKGIIADANGRMQLSRLEVRDSMTVRELLINKLSVIDGDQVLSEGDTIDTIDDLGSNCYGLHLKNKWDGYFTAQVVGNVLKGKINTLAEGNGTYYTSWMRVNSVNTANNYIEVVLYDDDDVPGGVNFPPCELMAIVRWGNQIDKTRQSCLYLSSTEGRITKLTGVTKPILESYNYGATIGSVPSFLKDLDLPLVDGQDYAYMRGLIVEDIIRIDYQGKPITEILDRGTWSEDSSYYSDALNPATGKYETSDVWYMGCKYRCAQTGTTTAPAWNNTDWAMVEGNPDFTVEFADTDFIFDPDRFSVTLEIIAKLYNINITSDILDADVTWTRYSEDAQGLERVASDNAWAIKRAGAGKTIQLTADDCDFNGYVPKTLRFTATVTLRDGMGTNNAIFEY